MNLQIKYPNLTNETICRREWWDIVRKTNKKPKSK